MIQFYFLAVLLNVFGGLLLFSTADEEKLPIFRSINESLRNNQAWRLMYILLAAIVALFKILSVTKGDVLIVGDLLPALSLLVIGFEQFLEYYRDRSTVEEGSMHRMSSLFQQNRRLLGIAAAVIGVVHFLFPRVLFL
jgi:accessory gene regulator protein AgrB